MSKSEVGSHPELRLDKLSIYKPPTEKSAVPSLQPNSDGLLQLSRRVDWRFLLPDPNLGQVACVGSLKGTLVQSLRQFSTSLTVFEACPECADLRAEYDLVVAKDPTCELLQWAAKITKPDGFLYMEIHRRVRPPVCIQWISKSKAPQFNHVQDCVAAIELLGFTNVQAHWHWPNFESCAELVPIQHNMAIRYSLSRRHGGAMPRLKASLARCMVRVGLFEHLIPCYSVLGVRV